MGVSEHTRELANRIKDRISRRGVNYLDLNDLLNVAVCAMDEEDDVGWALKVIDYVKQCCRYGIQNRIDIIQLDALEWKTLKCEAPYKFESFLIYMEAAEALLSATAEDSESSGRRSSGSGRRCDRILRAVAAAASGEIHALHFLSCLGDRPASREP